MQSVVQYFKLLLGFLRKQTYEMRKKNTKHAVEQSGPALYRRSLINLGTESKVSRVFRAFVYY